MKTLQEKYNGVLEGLFTKEQFIVEARRQHPNIITQHNSYQDAVQILKNRGLLFEDYENFLKQKRKEEEEGKEAKLGASKNLKKGDKVKVDKPAAEKLGLSPDEEYNINGFKETGKGSLGSVDVLLNNGKTVNIQYVKKVKSVDEVARKLAEARLTKKNLADYRYKPTNEMDNYPYEQILRGLRVELETIGVQGTPTAEEYKKALQKVLKNLEKDEIYYTNQLAGNTKKKDLHDKMVDATAKNTVDTFNGMKKVKNLKEDHTENPKDKYKVKYSKENSTYQVWEGDKLVTDFVTKEKAQKYVKKHNDAQDLSESTLKEGIKNLIKRILTEGEEEVYELFAEADTDMNEGPAKNDPKVERVVQGINQLISKAIDTEGDPIGVIEPGTTWEEPYIYQPIEYTNGALRITKKSPYQGKPTTEIILSRDMELDGLPTLRMIMKMYKAAIKKSEKHTPKAQENIHNTATMGGILGGRNYAAEAEEDREAVAEIDALVKSGTSLEDAISKISEKYRLQWFYLDRLYKHYIKRKNNSQPTEDNTQGEEVKENILQSVKLEDILD